MLCTFVYISYSANNTQIQTFLAYSYITIQIVSPPLLATGVIQVTAFSAVPNSSLPQQFIRTKLCTPQTSLHLIQLASKLQISRPLFFTVNMGGWKEHSSSDCFICDARFSKKHSSNNEISHCSALTVSQFRISFLAFFPSATVAFFGFAEIGAA